MKKDPAQKVIKKKKMARNVGGSIQIFTDQWLNSRLFVQFNITI